MKKLILLLTILILCGCTTTKSYSLRSGDITYYYDTDTDTYIITLTDNNKTIKIDGDDANIRFDRPDVVLKQTATGKYELFIYTELL